MPMVGFSEKNSANTVDTESLESDTIDIDFVGYSNVTQVYTNSISSPFEFKDYDMMISDSSAFADSYFGVDFFDCELTRIDCGGCTLCDYCNYKKEIRFNSEKLDLFEWFSDYDDFWYFDNKTENGKANNQKDILSIYPYSKVVIDGGNSSHSGISVLDYPHHSNIFELGATFENTDSIDSIGSSKTVTFILRITKKIVV
jgi:hypothetical protein